MDEEVQRALKKIVTLRGVEVMGDVRLVRALLNDFVPGRTAERRVLLAALEDRIPQQLLKEHQSGSVSPAQIHRLAEVFSKNTFLPPEIARKGVSAWCEALAGKVGESAADVSAQKLRPENATVGAPMPVSQNQVLPARAPLPDTLVVAPINLKMVRIRAGSFLMGTPGATNDEAPVQVTHTRDYWLGETPVTQAQWRTIMGTSPSYFKGDNLPVEQVSWHDAMDFCKKLTESERAAGWLPVGYAYTLPTEAEWEYGCRAGTIGEYSGQLDAMAWYRKNAEFTTHPVGTKQANGWGLYDMHGNVCEWCRDGYDEKLPGGTDPIGVSSGTSRVLRGGGWHLGAGYCRSAYRSCYMSAYRSDYSGFRLALSSVQSVKDRDASWSAKMPDRRGALRPDPAKSAADVSAQKLRPENATVGAPMPVSPQPLPARGPLPETMLVEPLSLKMVRIRAGSFLMGTPGAKNDESPVQVTLTRDYWLGETPVTQAQWRTIMDTSPSSFRGDNLPVEQVSWYDAMKFCKKLTAREQAAGRLPVGYAYTLPTEAQWEYACRAGTIGEYAGDLDAMAWYAYNAASTTHPVGTKQANAWGLYDMHGNVWEWCLDCYAPKLRGGVNPTGASLATTRVLRGGSWYYVAGGCRSANRFNLSPDGRNLSCGFRLALSSVR